MRLQDELEGEPQVVVQDRRHPSPAQQRDVLGVHVVHHEHPAAPLEYMQ